MESFSAKGSQSSRALHGDETQDGDCCVSRCGYGFSEAVTIVVVCYNKLFVQVGYVFLTKEASFNNTLKG